jgi:quercetin dioxygenase-like cupin family protein
MSHESEGPRQSKHAAIRFSSLQWEQGGHPLERKKRHPDHPITLLEFAPGFLDPAWCRAGHAGFVLSGSLRMEYEDGADDLGAGDGFSISPGTPHRASNPHDVPVQVFIFTWVATEKGSGAAEC